MARMSKTVMVEVTHCLVHSNATVDGYLALLCGAELVSSECKFFQMIFDWIVSTLDSSSLDFSCKVLYSSIVAWCLASFLFDDTLIILGLLQCGAAGDLVDEEPFRVCVPGGNREGVAKAREGRSKRLPGLMAGGHFCLVGNFDNVFPTKQDISKLVKMAGGKVKKHTPNIP